MFHVLLALSDGERHGYAIMLEVRERTAGSVHLGPGTLYRSLKTLLAQHMIEASGDHPDGSPDDERRRYYRLTIRGREAAIAEAERMDQIVQMARSKRLLGPEARSTRGGA